MSVMSLTTLPHEILESVFNEIDVSSPEGRQSISACSLTNTALRPFCQALLFHDIKITYTRRSDTNGHIVFGQTENTTGRKFLNLLCGSPHLSQCVKTLTISLLNNMYSFGHHLVGETTSATASFSLYEIVPKLTNLQEFTTSFLDRTLWDGLEERTRRFFHTTIPSLVTRLDVSIFDPFPLSGLYGCYQLEELRIASFRVDNGEEAPATMINSSKVKLQALELKGWGYSLDAPTIQALHGARSPLDFSRLQRFVSSSQSRPLTEIAGMLAIFHDGLKEVDFWMRIYDDEGPTFAKQVPDFGRFSNLRRLTIRTLIRFGRYYGGRLDDFAQEDNDFGCIARILQTLPVDAIQPQQLRVSLIFVLAYLPDIENRLPLLPWGDLLQVLEDGRLTSRFKSVELGIGRVEKDVLLFDMPLQVVSDILDKNAGLKRLRERGVLSYAYFIVPNRRT